MEGTDKKSIRIMPTTEGFREGRRFIVENLKKRRIAKPMISETLLVFEALFHEITEQGFGEKDGILLESVNRSGDSVIKIGFEGGVFAPDAAEGEEISPEKKILSAYAEMIDCRHTSGYNTVSLRVTRSHARTLWASTLAALIAVAVFAIIHYTKGRPAEAALFSNLVYPLEAVFTNAVIMIGAPVTFVSLLKNMTDTFVVAERHTGLRRLVKLTVLSSMVSTFLALVACRISVLLMGYEKINLHSNGTAVKEVTPKGLVMDLMPPDIFTPFQRVSPFPIVIIAVLVTYALCSAGKYFEMIKKAVDACYVLFARMLGIVTYALPVFAGVAVMDLLIRQGFDAGWSLLLVAVIAVVSPLLLVIYYLIRLLAAGIPVKDFVKKLLPLLNENMLIGSSIDAVPFNVRYCARTYGMDRRRLELSLPVLAEINLDGNCFIITLLSMLLLALSNSRIPVAWIILIPLMVLFLSFGAPNQPGSVLIGMMILLWSTESLLLLPLAILSEVLLSGILNIINVTGDIVTIAIEDKKQSEQSVQS